MQAIKWSMRWNTGGAPGCWWFEVKPDVSPVWFYVGSISYFSPNWIQRLFRAKCYWAIVNGGEIARFYTLEQACEYVQENGRWS